MLKKKSTISLAIVAALALAGCNGSSNNSVDLSAADALLLTASNKLVGFDRAAPVTSLGELTLSGFSSSGETVIGMDFRPFNGKLYVVTKDGSNAGRVYTADLKSGALTFIAQLAADPADTAPNSVSPATPNASFTTLLGNNFGVDFNPAADALRVVSDAGQNLRIFLDGDRRNKTPGFTITDGELSGGTAGFAVTSAAYTNSFDGTSTTALWDIDTANDRLVLQAANPGGLTDAGSIGVDATASNGFDIDPETNTGYALLTVNGTTGLYTLSIPSASGTLPTSSPATLVGAAAANDVVGLAIRPNQNPVVVGLAGSAATPSLVSFSPRSPNTTTSVAVTGLSTGDELLSIDFRPATGELFGLVRNGTSGKLVTINATTGAVTTLASLVDQSSPTTPITLDANKAYNIDFNPMADALRVVSTSAGGTGGNGENLRVVVKVAGADQPGYTFIEANAGGGNLSAGTGTAANFNVVNVAYTNSFGGTTSTALYDIDGNNNALLNQASANSGNLNLVGSLGTPLVSYGGFDITGGDNGSRLLAARGTASGPFSLFNIDVTTGTTTAAGNLTGGDNVIGGTTGPADLRDITIKFNKVR